MDTINASTWTLARVQSSIIVATCENSIHWENSSTSRAWKGRDKHLSCVQGCQCAHSDWLEQNAYTRHDTWGVTQATSWMMKEQKNLSTVNLFDRYLTRSQDTFNWLHMNLQDASLSRHLDWTVEWSWKYIAWFLVSSSRAPVAVIDERSFEKFNNLHDDDSKKWLENEWMEIVSSRLKSEAGEKKIHRKTFDACVWREKRNRCFPLPGCKVFLLFFFLCVEYKCSLYTLH